MLQKTKDVFVKFPPESMNQHMYSNQIKSDLEEVNHQYKGCDNESQMDKDGSSSKNAGFRFSISRLPEWARCQVINSSLPVDIDSTSSKVQQLNGDNLSTFFFLHKDNLCFNLQKEISMDINIFFF